MTLTIRARLTLWYSAIVVAVLATGAVVGVIAQSRLALERLDQDLARTMATLEGVMVNEFGEAMTLEGAAREASVEVVAPDRALAVTGLDGHVLAFWGLPLDRAALGLVPADAAVTTVNTRTGEARVLTRSVESAGHRYRAFVLAPLDELHEEDAETVRATIIGVLIALVAAAVGGWVIARQTLRPLTDMAVQAGRIDARDPRERLSAAHPGDELGQLAQSFNELLGRLQLALNQQRQFMADASHELRTPVSVVRTTTQVTLSREVRSPEEYRESLVIVAEQAGRLSKLVDAMFLLSRAEAHGVPLRPEFLNLDEMLSDSARALRVLADQRGVRIRTDGDQEVGFTGDDALLRQMIGNLLDNAIRHATQGGDVVAALRRVPGALTLEVSNDGDGITPADRERIFQRFVRVGASDGAGLGLPIARWIAEAHGGTLILGPSEPGRTTFIVSLPA